MKQNDPAPAGRPQRLVLMILVFIFLAPVFGSWIIFNFTDIGRGGAVSSHGDLIIPPRLIADITLIDPENRNQAYSLYGRWSIVYLVAAECDSVCEEKLYMMRQIRLAMDTDSRRLQRILFVFGEEPRGLTDIQAKAFPGQLTVHADSTLGTIFKLTESESPLDLRRLYIIDPRGYLMMSYADGTNPSGIIKDLRRLLKYSSIG